MTEEPIIEVAVWLTHTVKQMKSDPRECYVTLMTAAAIAGHMIERTPEEMAQTLSDVEGLAHLKMLQITEEAH